MRRRSCHRDLSRRDSSPGRRLAAGLVPLAGAGAAVSASTLADEPAPDGGDELFDLRMGDAVQVADRNRRLRQQAEVEHARKLQEREEAEASRARAADHRRTLANVELEAPSHDRPDMFGHSSEVKEAALADSGSSHALGGAPRASPTSARRRSSNSKTTRAAEWSWTSRRRSRTRFRGSRLPEETDDRLLAVSESLGLVPD